MPKFRYKALDASGKLLVGAIDAPSQEAVMPELQKLAVFPIEISAAGEPSGTIANLFARSPTPEDITRLTEDLGTLLRGGVTLDRALLILSETSTRAVTSRLMLDLNRSIASGSSLAESVAAYPAIFPRTYAKMVEAAEVAGTLDETLAVIAHERSRGESLKRRITSALAYPSFLAFAATGVLVFVLMAIIPEFERALAGFQAEGSTETVFALSRTLRAHSSLFATAAILVLLAGLLIFRSRAAKASLLGLVGRVPGVRQVMRYERAVSFCATLGTVTRSGVDITTALRLIRDLMRDRRSTETVDALVAGVRQGRRLSEALAETDLLPLYAVHMLRVGEESGELDAAALRIAGFYEDRLDRALSSLTSILGPAIMILVSLLIAWLIISVITALLSVNELLL